MADENTMRTLLVGHLSMKLQMCTRKPGFEVRPQSGPSSGENHAGDRKYYFRFGSAILENGRQYIFSTSRLRQSPNSLKFHAGDSYNAKGKLFPVCRRLPVAMFQNGR